MPYRLIFASIFLVVKIPDLHFYTYALLDSGELCILLAYIGR